ncbi:MAG TPA: ZIP family metal transporter [bacterium]|nr:ZIP family metal transporter [bacterium]HNS33810.1 ZIP family metal transporter [bacterium]HNZ73353.1 ZIP family metal transporter [bacterium]HOH66981.1 ZIP family metal transporter [bacterium]HQA63650.1 ZIP family metal transporter [bacterium]
MSNNLILSLLAVLVVSLASLVGVIGLIFSKNILDKALIILVSFAAGSLMGGAFFHILPEQLEASNDSLQLFVYVVAGFCLFFFLERILRWHHCHKGHCDTHAHLGWLNLVGDGVHNFIDGMVIFAAFSVGPLLGGPVLLSIIFHEIPQELGDFGVLVYSGFSRFKALVYNFISALLSFAGVIVAFIFYYYNLSIEDFLLPLAAGGFIYIAASDLVPELHQTKKIANSLLNFVVFGAALVLMWFLKIFFE